MAFSHISCKTLAEQLEHSDAPPVVIDIRDAVSFEQGHISGAIRIDNDNVADFIKQADLSRPLVVCCYHGNSSQGAADFFSQHGFDATYSLDGGYELWRTTQPNDK